MRQYWRVKNIKELMKVANLTQKEIAERLGISQPTVSEMLNPKTDPRLSTLRRLKVVFNCDLEEIAACYQDQGKLGKSRLFEAGAEYDRPAGDLDTDRQGET
jgi:transcriptional regulator with XRE-family HTH domain